ncbi:MAG: hypothetical protein LBD67_05945 [Candidatus Accumulibacter sp.]|jgi:hypothetical protein|nr:hypothetical protein [Accumulibacter sp.]
MAFPSFRLRAACERAVKRARYPFLASHFPTRYSLAADGIVAGFVTRFLPPEASSARKISGQRSQDEILGSGVDFIPLPADRSGAFSSAGDSSGQRRGFGGIAHFS